MGLATVAAFSGCNTCTLIACSDSVAFQLGAAAQQFGTDEPVTVTACVGDACVTEVVTKPAGSGGFVGTAVKLDTDGTLRFTFNRGAQTSKNVSLKLKKNEMVVLDQARSDVVFSALDSNRLSCEGCQSATVTLE